ncbi:MAG: FAD-binding protein [Chloroflexi bacterium]|nr:FAD-binding protein [Chloroflexota bacterium]
MRKIPWHQDADVVIIGYGAAGAVAAITAHDGGSQTIIVEKQDGKTALTSSAMAAGVIICPNDLQGSRRYMEALYKVNDGLYWTEPDVIRAWAQYTSENKTWLESMGGVMELNRRGGAHNVPGFESIDIYRFRGMGFGLMRLLRSHVDKRNIPVVDNTAATALLLNTEGEIVGIAAQNRGSGDKVNIRARRGVVLATGGFEFNEQMKLQYLAVHPCYFTASPANTGDGVVMAQEAGAQLWHMSCCAAGLRMKFPEVPSAMMPALGGKHWTSPGQSVLANFGGAGLLAQYAERAAAVAGYIVVDRDGKRYTNENFKVSSVYYELQMYDSRRLFFPRVPSYWVFDQRRMNDGYLVGRSSGAAGPGRLYDWSPDNSKELDRGWIKSGNTIRELAGKLGIEADALAATVRDYNRYCKNGIDMEFAREPATLIPLREPPYYAVQLWPGGANTQGGPRRDSQARVLRADGSPIPRLYGAGELGSIYGMLYPGSGGNLAECIAFGRIAGEEASHCRPS